MCSCIYKNFKGELEWCGWDWCFFFIDPTIIYTSAPQTFCFQDTPIKTKNPRGTRKKKTMFVSYYFRLKINTIWKDILWEMWACLTMRNVSTGAGGENLKLYLIRLQDKDKTIRW